MIDVARLKVLRKEYESSFVRENDKDPNHLEKLQALRIFLDENSLSMPAPAWHYDPSNNETWVCLRGQLIYNVRTKLFRYRPFLNFKFKYPHLLNQNVSRITLDIT